MPRYRYFDFMLAGMVVVLLCSNLIGPAKVCTVNLPFYGAISFAAGNLFFPIGYIFDDLITEVYGYARARRATWAGFAALIFAVAMTQVVLRTTPSPAESFNAELQPALEVVFGNTWRIIAASIAGYWLGDFANAYVMAKMKIWTSGKHLWTRTVGSTVIGEGLDSLTFYPIAFYGLWSNEVLLKVILFNFLVKVGVEVALTPVTYAAVAFLKRHEGIDTYDFKTRFNPFSLRNEGITEPAPPGATP